MSAHTPGPWSWGDDYQGLFGSGPNNEVLTHYNYEGMHLSYGDKQDANARLMAASPMLLAALKLFNNDASLGHAASGVYTITVDGRDLLQMRAAIAAAIGAAT